MAELFASTFNGDENPLSEGGNWESSPGAFGDVRKVSGTLRGVTTDHNAGRVSTTAATVPNDQYAQATLASTDQFQVGGVLVRVKSSTDGDSYAWLGVLNTNFGLYRVDDTGSLAFTLLGAEVTEDPADGDVVRLEVTGSNFEMFKNAVSKGTRTDSTYATGQPGIEIFGSLTALPWALDTFSCGSLVAGIVGPLVGPGHLGKGGPLIGGRLVMSPGRFEQMCGRGVA